MSAAPSRAAPVTGDAGAPLESIAWQAFGSAATLAAAGWVSWRFGLAAQGEFGLARSWFDAAASIAALGLPQGLLHLQYRRAVPGSALRGWLLRFVALLALLALGLALLAALTQATLVAWVLLSAPFGAAHLLARSLLLHGRGAVWFGFATALPALLILGGTLLWALLDRPYGFAALLLAAVAGAASISVLLAWPVLRGRAQTEWLPRELWQVSLHSWVQAALAALLLAALLGTIAASGQGDEELGRASLGLHVYQAFAALAGYVSPLLFDRLARRAAHAATPGAAAATLGAAAVTPGAAATLGTATAVPGGRWLAAGAIGWLAIALLVAWRWPQWWPLWLMVPAGVAAAAARLASTVLQSRGDYHELSRQAIWRLMLAVALLVLGMRWLPAAAAAALALLAVESATWLRCRSRGRGP